MGISQSSDVSQRIEVLEGEIDRLRQDNEFIKSKYERLLSNIREEKDLRREISNVSNISNEAIDRFVQSLIDDPNTNIYGLPDRAEKLLYRNTLRLVLGSMEKIFDNTGIEFVGHRLKVTIQPIEQNQTE